MNEYLIEWLNMKIDESLHNNNLEDYDHFVKLKEIIEREEEDDGYYSFYIDIETDRVLDFWKHEDWQEAEISKQRSNCISVSDKQNI